MSFIELAEKRYSVRNFSSKQVEQEKIEQLLRAGQLAPTACNNQPQVILVLESQEALNKIRGCTNFLWNAGLAFLICYDKTKCWEKASGYKSGETDAAIVTSHIMLEAADIGLGSTWVASFDEFKAAEAFGLPEEIVPFALLPVGYPAEDAVPAAGHFSRKDLQETVVYK